MARRSAVIASSVQPLFDQPAARTYHYVDSNACIYHVQDQIMEQNHQLIPRGLVGACGEHVLFLPYRTSDMASISPAHVFSFHLHHSQYSQWVASLISVSPSSSFIIHKAARQPAKPRNLNSIQSLSMPPSAQRQIHNQQHVKSKQHPAYDRRPAENDM